MRTTFFFVISSLCLAVNALPAINVGKAGESTCGYDSCHATDPNMLNVHLVPHTHDDVGWLKTVDQYYYGSNKARHQKASVQYIIDSVIQGLLESPSRRFVYVESAFFSRWWDEQEDELKEKVKVLVNEGRLEFIGGAWSMNDEATTHYQSIVDQFTLGTRFLNETFGECARPRIGWQIDPFGHSREQASLFAKMGYDGLFFARLDYQDKRQRLTTQTMEMIWEASENLDNTDIFTGALYAHYSPPSGFCFDILCDDEPIIDDVRSPDYNVRQRVQDFVDYANTQATRYRTNNILMTMGDDFHYMSANLWFKNIDKLIKYTNELKSEFNVNLLYSTPSCYLKALHEANVEWPTKTDDFFPYSNDPHAFWTGYYTSRPTSKRLERVGNQFLQICKQLSATANLTAVEHEDNLDRMRRIMGVMQHHDAVTGTEKQHVADDYHRELTASISACEVNAKSSLDQIATKRNSTNASTKLEFEFNSCLNLNISDCSVTQNSQNFIVTVYNPLAHVTNQFVRFPVSNNNYIVYDENKLPVEIQLVPIPQSVKNIHYRTATAQQEIIFQSSDIPALGYKSYYVARQSSSVQSETTKVNAEPTTIGSDSLKLIFNSDGFLSEIFADGQLSQLKQNFWIYDGAMGNNAVFENRSSGAYIFRPDPANGDAYPSTDAVSIEVVRGDHVDEVHQIFNEWISQVVRVFKTENLIEFEWLVGPIPVDDNKGREIISRFETNMATNKLFSTDSNGREMLERTRNVRETWEIDLQEAVSGNYYPINTKIAIEDGTHRLAVLTDRAQGGSSIHDGSVELMVHRRLLRDDAFGVAEALNEQVFGQGLIARGKHWLVFGKKTNEHPTLKARERVLQNQVLMSNWMFFDSVTESLDDWTSKYLTSYSAIGMSLPENVYLMTYEPWRDNSFLLRFEHILEENEDPELSKAVSFYLTEVFPGNFEFSETTLAGNQWIADLDRVHFKPIGDEAFNETTKPTTRNTQTQKILSNTIISLKPMEIRTFVMSMPKYEVSLGIKSQVTFIFFPFIVLLSIMKNLF